jgi:pyrrolidone-carboxylate peptidase
MNDFYELERLRNSNELYAIVTGFEPFRTVKVNPSWQAAKHLHGEIKGVKVLVFEIPVVYSLAQKVIPLLHLSKTTSISNPPLFILHLGASGQRPRCFMRFESQAHGVGYHNKRDNQQTCPPGGLLRLEKPYVQGPRKPVTLLQVNNDLGKKLCVKLARDSEPLGIERHAWSVEVSNDAGRYLCEYVFHLSLRCARIASKWKRDKEVPVNFLHVPIVDEGKDDAKEHELLDQSDVDEAVKAIVTSMIHLRNDFEA